MWIFIVASFIVSKTVENPNFHQLLKHKQTIHWNSTQNKKPQQTTDSCNNMDESQKHYVEWKESDTKENMLYYSIYMIQRKGKIPGTGREVDTSGWE